MRGLEASTLSRFKFGAKAVGTVRQMSLSCHSSVGEMRSRLRQRTEITGIANEAGDKKRHNATFLASGNTPLTA